MKKIIMAAATVCAVVAGYGESCFFFGDGNMGWREEYMKGYDAEYAYNYYGAYWLTADGAKSFVGETATFANLSAKLESLFAKSGYKGVVSGLEGSMVAGKTEVNEMRDGDGGVPEIAMYWVKGDDVTYDYANGFVVALYDNGEEQAYSLAGNAFVDRENESAFEGGFFDNWYTDVTTQTSWKAFSSVPEPTSGLLLLVGMGLLGLKRKRV